MFKAVLSLASIALLVSRSTASPAPLHIVKAESVQQQTDTTPVYSPEDVHLAKRGMAGSFAGAGMASQYGMGMGMGGYGGGYGMMGGYGGGYGMGYGGGYGMGMMGGYGMY